tara:strand:- start:17235 stop:17702 length:468 start_codon:yes stop_codon:yes gene_type:complete
MKRLDITSEKALGILNKVHFFDNFSNSEKDLITGFHSHFFLASKGQTLISEGAVDDSFYVILTGKVAIIKKDAPRPIAALHPGDCFGEISFLTKHRRTTSVKSLADCILFEIDRPTLQHMDAPIREKLKDNLIDVLVNRLNHMNDLVTRLSLRIA